MLKLVFNYIKKEKILRGSIILILSAVILYVCSYLYHFYTGRILGPEDYGIIGALFSLLYIILVPFNAIQISITKFVSEFKAKEEYGKIKYLLRKSLKRLFLYGVIISFIFILASPFISKFLNIPSTTPVMILGLIILFSLLLPVTRGVLQGLQAFKSLGINMSFEGLSKVFFVVLLVSLGFGVNGAIFALVLSFIVAFLIILWQLRGIFNYTQKRFSTKQVYSYSWPVLLAFLTFTLIFSLDILIVKHFFDSIQAGYYAALSMMGKIVFFLNFPIIQVMFPIVSEDKIISKKKNSIVSILYKSFIIMLLICIGVTGFYFLFPEFMINILFGKDYLTIAPLLGYFAIFMSFFSLSYLLAFYNLSLNKTKFIPILIIATLLEIGLLWIFNANLSQIIFSLIILSLLLFISLVIYTIIKNGETIINNTGIQRRKKYS